MDNPGDCLGAFVFHEFEENPQIAAGAARPDFLQVVTVPISKLSEPDIAHVRERR
jgi:hypothetical protein